jgi:hypothetical protein
MYLYIVLDCHLTTVLSISTFENAMASVEEARKTIPMSEILGGTCPSASLPHTPATMTPPKQVQQIIDAPMEPPTPHQDEPDKIAVKKKPEFCFVTGEEQLQSYRKQISSLSDNELRSLAKSTMWSFTRKSLNFV